MKKYLIGSCVVNEGEKVLRLIAKLKSYTQYDILLVDDGSSDGSVLRIEPLDHLKIIHHPSQKGAGYCVREIFDYAKKNGYIAVFFISGNDKDLPEDLKKLEQAVEDGYDFVQGSRYLKGGRYGQMPLYRIFATKYMHPWLFSLLAVRFITDSTNGFRAVRLAMLEDPRINLHQEWLEQYELEPYLFYKAIQLGYKVKEVPVSKIYPPVKEGYTKMKPLSGWWSILRPLFLLFLRIKK